MAERKDMSGALFKNHPKKSETHPDYTGSAIIEGVDYFMDAWINEIKNGDKAGQKYVSVKFKPKGQAQGNAPRPQGNGRPPANTPAPATKPIDDEDIPW